MVNSVVLEKKFLTCYQIALFISACRLRIPMERTFWFYKFSSLRQHPTIREMIWGRC